MWRCICSCGTEKIIMGSDLRAGKSRSCGCASRQLKSEKISTHGESRTRLYRIWKSMRNRCANPNSTGFEIYGGKGITVCPEWSSYEAFREWALSNGYSSDLSIDRIENNLGYEPGNCRWATKQTQSENRGFVQRAPDGELWWHKAQKNNITQTAYRTRLNDGWSHEEASSFPMYKKRASPQRGADGRFT